MFSENLFYIQPSPQLQGQISIAQSSPWQQQQQNHNVQSQVSPQTAQGQWQFPGQPNFGRPEFRYWA